MRLTDLRKWLLVGIALLLALCCVACSESATIGEVTPLEIVTPTATTTVTPDELHQFKIISDAYTSVNDWPSEKLYYALGISLKEVLADIDRSDTLITFEGADGYHASLTAAQLFAPRYTYVGGEAKEVEPLLAYRMIESDDAAALKDAQHLTLPTLIFGQENESEHTNPAFVEDIVRIEISDHIEQWSIPTIAEDATVIEAGETVKLLHPDFSKVKIYYTLDGSDPSIASTLYNPSTYQPQLNTPITLHTDTTLKAIVLGYGRQSSPIASFEIEVKK